MNWRPGKKKRGGKGEWKTVMSGKAQGANLMSNSYLYTAYISKSKC